MEKSTLFIFFFKGFPKEEKLNLERQLEDCDISAENLEVKEQDADLDDKVKLEVKEEEGDNDDANDVGLVT